LSGKEFSWEEVEDGANNMAGLGWRADMDEAEELNG